MQSAETVLDVLRERSKRSRSSHWRALLPGNWHGGFGPGGCWKRTHQGTSPAAHRYCTWARFVPAMAVKGWRLRRLRPRIRGRGR